MLLVLVHTLGKVEYSMGSVFQGCYGQDLWLPVMHCVSKCCICSAVRRKGTQRLAAGNTAFFAGCCCQSNVVSHANIYIGRPLMAEAKLSGISFAAVVIEDAPWQITLSPRFG